MAALKKLPVVSPIRTLARITRFTTNPISVLEEYLEDYGESFIMYMGGSQRSIITTNPDFAQYVLQKNHRNYKKSSIQTEHLGQFIGQGLLTSNGAYWLQQRRLIQPGFHRNRLAGLVNLIQEVIDEYLEDFDVIVKAGKPIDIYPSMMRLTFRIVVRALFSASLKEADLERLSVIISEIQEFVIRIIRQPFLRPIFRLQGQYRKHIRLMHEANEIILSIIRERRASGKEQDDLLQMLLDARYEDTGKGMTDQQLIEEATILTVAGHETTANAMSWTWYLMSQHPEAVKKMRAEQNQILQNGPLAFENLRQLTYTTQVIEESMRIYPPAWITDREAIEADEFEGIPIPKGTVVVPYIYGLHHSSQLWDQPATFRPERFAPEANKQHHSFRYLPFGAGPRMCIGNNFAIMEMQLILSSMLQRYDFKLAPNAQIAARPLVTLRPKNGVPMLFTDRRT
ncbi:MAG: cytochrome P450 [Saprospiraceae bacterium]|nr:MAG: cytochrome P450 [Saprospiraceae bacterium]